MVAILKEETIDELPPRCRPITDLQPLLAEGVRRATSTAQLVRRPLSQSARNTKRLAAQFSAAATAGRARGSATLNRILADGRPTR